MVRCECGMTQEELEKTKSQLSTITAALESANKARDSAADALDSMTRERDVAVKEKEREAIMRTEETAVLKETVAKCLQQREAALVQVHEFGQKYAAREKDKEKEKLLRLVSAKLTQLSHPLHHLACLLHFPYPTNVFRILLIPCVFQENKRLTAELKEIADKLSLQESKTKQLTATLKAKNGEIIKLSKALRAVENDLGEDGAIAQACSRIKTNLMH